MQSKEIERLKQEERDRERAGKAERFWQAFQLTENGRVKSTLLLYSFFLSMVFLAVYFAAYLFLLEPLHTVVGGAPTAVVHLVEALVPAVAGTAVCALTWLLPLEERRLMPAAYLWLLALALACLAAMLLMMQGDAQAQLLFLEFFVLSVPAPILLGGVLSAFLYQREQRHRSNVKNKAA